MPGQCPRCKGSLNDEPTCPTCGFQVQSAPAEERRTKSRPASQPAKWQQTAMGKTLIGLVLAVGLFIGLMMLARAVLSAVGGDARQEWLGSFGGLLLIQ